MRGPGGVVKRVIRVYQRFGWYYAEVTPEPARASPRIAEGASLDEVMGKVSPNKDYLVEVDASAKAVAS